MGGPFMDWHKRIPPHKKDKQRYCGVGVDFPSTDPPQMEMMPKKQRFSVTFYTVTYLVLIDTITDAVIVVCLGSYFCDDAENKWQTASYVKKNIEIVDIVLP
jgi:hypothetical protein